MFKHVAIQFFLLAAISALSRYEVRDLSNVPIEVVNFLTPLGIAANLFTNNELSPFYWQKSQGQISLGVTQVLLIVCLYVFLLLNLWQFLRKNRSG